MSFEQEAMREYARNVGMEQPDREWINTPLDSWEKNPFYTGEPGPLLIFRPRVIFPGPRFRGPFHVCTRVVR
jgi:hypothetical protein